MRIPKCPPYPPMSPRERNDIMASNPRRPLPTRAGSRAICDGTAKKRTKSAAPSGNPAWKHCRRREEERRAQYMGDGINPAGGQRLPRCRGKLPV